MDRLLLCFKRSIIFEMQMRRFATSSLRRCAARSLSVKSVVDAVKSVGSSAKPPPPPPAPPAFPTVEASLAQLGNSPDTFVFRKMGAHEFDQVDAVVRAYNGYYDHMRFRKGWSEPTWAKDATADVFREAAECVVRIRQFLDSQSDEPKLRVLDGNAQAWLHGDDAKAAADFRTLLVPLVHESFKDARGYREGLSQGQVDTFLARLSDHRFNPRTHVEHALLEAAGLTAGCAMANLGGSGGADAPRFVVDGSEEDLAWRAAIGKMYEALDALEAVKRLQPPPPAGGK
jgi:hypothetical protein